MTIIAVNNPVGTITVRWNDDPTLEWNHEIPIDDNTGMPVNESDLKRVLVASVYNTIIEKEKREIRSPDYTVFDNLLNKTFDVQVEFDEYKLIKDAQPVV